MRGGDGYLADNIWQIVNSPFFCTKCYFLSLFWQNIDPWCEGELCLHCCGGFQAQQGDQGLDERVLERVETLAESGMRCGVILGQAARTAGLNLDQSPETVCDGDKVCYVCRP